MTLRGEKVNLSSKRIGFAFLTLSLCMFAACNTDTLETDLPSTNEEATFIPVIHPSEKGFVRSLLQAQGQEKKELLAQIQSAAQIGAVASQGIQAASDWAEADEYAREVIASNTGHPLLHQFEQVIARQMLSERLLPAEPTTESREAIAYYTRLLIKNKYPDVTVLQPALAALGGYWSSNELISAAKSTVSNAEAWLDRNPCDECLGAGKQAGQLSDSRKRLIYQVNAALPELREMARGE